MGKRTQYSFSKRQREIKKKKKAEEKRARKMAKTEGEEDGVDLPLDGELGPEESEALEADEPRTEE